MAAPSQSPLIEDTHGDGVPLTLTHGDCDGGDGDGVPLTSLERPRSLKKLKSAPEVAGGDGDGDGDGVPLTSLGRPRSLKSTSAVPDGALARFGMRSRQSVVSERSTFQPLYASSCPLALSLNREPISSIAQGDECGHATGIARDRCPHTGRNHR